MLNITFKFSCDQNSHTIEAKSSDIISESLRKLLRTRPEYYHKIKIFGLTLEGHKLDQDDSFLEADISDNEVIHVECKFKEQSSGEITYFAEPETEILKKPSGENKTLAELKVCYYVDNINQKVLLFGDKFYNRECSRIEIYVTEDDKKIDTYEYVFDCSGVHYIRLLIKEKISNFSYMFCGCYNLVGIEGELDVSECKDFGWMFGGCSSLQNVDSLSNWNVSKAEDFRCMFYGCASLQNVYGLLNWNTSNVTNFDTMFG